MPATGTEMYEQVPDPVTSKGGSWIPAAFRRSTGSTGTGISHFFWKKQVFFESLKEPLYFQAVTVVQSAPVPETGCWLSGFCAFSQASKKQVFIAIKTGIFVK